MGVEVKDFSQTVNRIYQKHLARFGAEGAQLRDVMDSARPEIRMMIDSGELAIDIDGVIDAELLSVDSSNGKQADRVLAHLADGEGSLYVDGDPMLDVVVTLGKGLRKQWRDITSADLVLMDELRYQNVRKQQNAYSTWRSVFAPVAAALVPFGTIGDAVAAGVFDTAERRTA